MDGKLVHRRVTHGINYFAGNHLYTSMERGIVGVKCLVQEDNKLHGQGSTADRIVTINCTILLLSPITYTTPEFQINKAGIV